TGQTVNSSTVNSDNCQGNTATATLEVVVPPVVSKSFNPTTIFVNGTSVLTFDAVNPNSATTLTNVNFTDTLPAGLIIATPNNINGVCTGGSLGVANSNYGGNQISLFGTTLVPNSHSTSSITA